MDKPYRMSEKFKIFWQALPIYDNKGSSIWAYRVFRRLNLNDDSFNIKDIVEFTRQYFDDKEDNKYLLSPGKILELGYSRNFEHETEAEKFRKLYTRGTR